MIQYGMRRWMILVLLLLGMIAGGSGPANGQIKSLSLKQQAQAAMAGEDGLPERGRFVFVYSYSGEPINPVIELSVNGGQAASLGGLAPVQDDTLVNVLTSRGDKVNLFASFGLRQATIFLHTGLTGYAPGFWGGGGSLTFFEVSAEGTITKIFGTMEYFYTHTPPWRGIDIAVSPPEIVPG